MLWNKFNLFIFKIISILYCPSQRKQHVYGNLASWMMVQAPLSTARLFWFYYTKTKSLAKRMNMTARHVPIFNVIQGQMISSNSM